ncbi:MAG: hypothetical protein AAGD12_07300, partial [Pseudomonadota bacterium]
DAPHMADVMGAVIGGLRRQQRFESCLKRCLTGDHAACAPALAQIARRHAASHTTLCCRFTLSDPCIAARKPIATTA